jgi:3-phosphoshikimate 1-carboxyvinyltransferase
MRLHLPSGPLHGEINLPISKSIANRYLIISALAGERLSLPDNLPEDVKILRSALNSDKPEINIGMSGTAMRFLTASYAVQDGRTVVLTGAERMRQRPIGELVDSLIELGAEIEYLKEEGFPPLKIVGKNLEGGEVKVSASVSSQFVSALMMIGPIMNNGLKIHLEGKVLSKPYIELTAECMRKCGAEVQIGGSLISIESGHYTIPELAIESDWSSASYFYAIVAARPNSKFLLKGLKLDSSQGDSVLVKWFSEIGVPSVQRENGVEIESGDEIRLPQEIDFTHNPDLAQTIAFLAATSGQSLKLTGLDNLRVKETDRVAALKTELEKLGVSVSVQENEMAVSGSISVQNEKINTYNDHRMAMSAAVVSTLVSIEIENPGVVAKSFPGFWRTIWNN